MKIFISYPSERRSAADALRLALEAEGHDVFFDRTDLPAGEAFHQRIRQAVHDADLMVFFVCPESVDAGYALTELAHAQSRWPRPSGHVLPVLLAPVPWDRLPPYLQSVTLLQPRGDMVAETVAAVAALARRTRRWHRLAMPLAGVALLALAAGAYVQFRQAEQQRDFQAQQAAVAREVAAAAELCQGGSEPVGWARLETLAAQHPASPEVRTAQEDCGMAWLRVMRTVGEKQTFGEQVDRVQPVLVRALASAQGERLGDLHAHIGWGEFLRWRDGQGDGNPVPHYRRAVQADADNPYAHAMWAHRIAWMHEGEDAMREQFEAALRTPRARSYVRGMQLAVAQNRYALVPYALQAAQSMRVQGESPSDDQRERLWFLWCEQGLVSTSYRDTVLAALDPAQAVATYGWLWPAQRAGERRQASWHFCTAALQAHAGQVEAARTTLHDLLATLGAEAERHRAGREAAALLLRLKG